MAPLSLVQVANHMLGTVAISHSPVSLVHTIKSLTPLFIVAFYWAFHNAKYSRSTIVSLYMLVFGVGLTCYKAASLTLIGFAYSLMASIAYACGTILNKKLLGSGRQQQQQQQQQRVGKLSIIFHTSIMSMIFLIPVWLGSGEQNVIHSIFAAQTVSSGRPRHLIWLVLFNSLVHFAQVILSIKLLSMTTAVSYSIASLFKRVFVIVVAIVWFRQSVTATQAFGLIVTFCGLYLYDRAKASSFPPTARLPLPSSTSASASGEASASDIDLGKPWGRRGED
ncbi:hypothetical protein EV182_005442 [Spiromyces aspiralis]|uniref:Uncharacterized protein n=1 Tax=Spiromyces aspiralis TaxID=68401 RepID=A0ACC1HR14_9FUNG|nr:hypothetical protein EV182_005442 [Spiromyces aspiralis]